MKTLLLLSVLLAAIGIPALGARDPSPQRGLRRVLAALLVANALYVAYLTQLHPVLFVPSWP
jgi:hypothetical protein